MRQTAIDCNNSYIDPYIFEPASLGELGIFYEIPNAQWAMRRGGLLRTAQRMSASECKPLVSLSRVPHSTLY